MRLVGDLGANISQTMDSPSHWVYSDGEINLAVEVNKLLPYTLPELDPTAPGLYLNNTPPPITLTCHPYDGLVAIPFP